MSDIMSSGKAAKFLGVAVGTLRRWDKEGRLVPAVRTETNRRMYTEAQLQTFLGEQPVEAEARRVVAYCRVSSQAQKPDLVNQRHVLEAFVVAKGLANVDFLEEIGGGLNFKRPVFLKLMDDIGRGHIQTLILAHTDRLTRFGFEWFQHYAQQHDCEVLVLNQERLSPEQEMVQDMMAIVHCFSSRLYGLRNYKKSLDKALKSDGVKV